MLTQGKNMKHEAARQQGFSLLEVLVSLLILMVGLLGIAGLMIKGQRASFEAYQRQQALALAQDMAERIRANRGAGPFYITTGLPSMPGDGDLYAARQICDDGFICNQQRQLADYDLATWDGMLIGASKTKDDGAGNVTNIGGLVNAYGCVEWNANVNQPVFVVSVAWQGDAPTNAPAASTCADTLYPDAALRRVVALNVSGCRLNGADPWGCSPLGF